MSKKIRMVCSGETWKSLLTKWKKQDRVPCPQCKGKRYIYVDKLP